MSVGIEIRGYRTLHIKLDAITGALLSNKRFMGQLGAFMSLRVKKRTAKGMDADDKGFISYSPQYAAKRSEAGLSTKPVDLFFTGSMLSAMTYKAEDREVELFFINTTDKFGVRNPAKAFYNQQTRKFFSISAQDVADVETLVRTYIAKRMKKKRK